MRRRIIGSSERWVLASATAVMLIAGCAGRAPGLAGPSQPDLPAPSAEATTEPIPSPAPSPFAVSPAVSPGSPFASPGLAVSPATSPGPAVSPATSPGPAVSPAASPDLTAIERLLDDIAVSLKSDASAVADEGSAQ